MSRIRIQSIAATLALAFLGTAVPCAPALAGARDMAAGEPLDTRYQKLSQEADRNREMIEIWKDHVRTLTQERDEAYRKIEEMKTQGTSAVETEAAPAEPQQDVTALTGEKDAALARVRELQDKLSALEADRRSDTARKEIEELRNDKNVLVGDKERALARVQELENKLQKMQTESQTARRDAAQERGLDASPELVALRSRVSSLEAENTSLKAAATHAPSSLALAETETERDRLRRDVVRLEDELKNAKAAATGSTHLSERVKKLERQEHEAAYERESLTRQTEEQKAKIASLEAENRRLASAPRR
ncbi:MAG TPA: hypothetical protein VL404_06095, partial [Candidatus Eisenbacteria bacterium]|nr:hypothetical protein [Candidatus Eisenbacteria bacterium]